MFMPTACDIFTDFVRQCLEIMHFALRATKTIIIDHRPNSGNIEECHIKNWLPRYLTSLSNANASAFEAILTMTAPVHPRRGPEFVSFVRAFPKLQALNILFRPQERPCINWYEGGPDH
jgi:hypothetical protein